ncbi:OLC1v1015669C1 [Oldenlandia corymbosa var. corymbosa]|uniref:OLC1v1015669C1 n=1 Tax=Oldenlandia corymbosa var. corymbosa TaxID=529605 RepID=A0AAV1E4N6_OLDCO|nr:OLC1v1015669C1 [Oldenlandia corymbosa var. corymbosa]
MRPKKRKQRTPGQKGKESDLVLHEPTRKSARTTKEQQLVDANKPAKATKNTAGKKLVVSEAPKSIDTRPREGKPFDCRVLHKLLHKVKKSINGSENYRHLQREAIREFGFGSLLNLKIESIPHALCHFLAGNFQTGGRTITLNNGVLDFTEEDVVAVLDLPRGPKKPEQFAPNKWDYPEYVPHATAWRKRMNQQGLPVYKSDSADILELCEKGIQEPEHKFQKIIEEMLNKEQKPSTQKIADDQEEAEETDLANALGLEQLSETNEGECLPVNAETAPPQKGPQEKDEAVEGSRLGGRGEFEENTKSDIDRNPKKVDEEEHVDGDIDLPDALNEKINHSPHIDDVIAKATESASRSCPSSSLHVMAVASEHATKNPGVL